MALRAGPRRRPAFSRRAQSARRYATLTAGTTCTCTRGSAATPSELPIGSGGGCALRVRVLDAPDHARGRAGRDAVVLDVVGHDAACSDHAALTDAHAAGDHDVGAEPAVVSDPGRSLALEPLPGDRLLGVAEAVAGV